MLDPGGEANAPARFICIKRWYWNVTRERWLSASGHASHPLLHRDDAVRAGCESPKRSIDHNETSTDDDEKSRDNEMAKMDNNDESSTESYNDNSS